MRLLVARGRGMFLLPALVFLILPACSQALSGAGDSTTASASAGPSFRFQGDFRRPLGIQLYSVREAMARDVPGTLAWVRQQGFRDVELAGTYGLSPAQFRQELDRAGLRAVSMHIGYNLLRDSLQSALDQARTLGVENLGIASLPIRGTFTDSAARALAADFNRIGAAAKARGLHFFYHTHGREFTPLPDGRTAFDVLVQATDPELVKYEMDVLWVAMPGQDAAALLKRYPNRWTMMHLKDVRQGTPMGSGVRLGTDAEVAVGAGMIPFPQILKAAQQVGVKEYFVEDETTAPMENIPRSIHFMETMKF